MFNFCKNPHLSLGHEVLCIFFIYFLTFSKAELLYEIQESDKSEILNRK